MNAAWICIAALLIFTLGYRWYARFLAQKLFVLRDDEAVPAHSLRDGKDFVPAAKHVLLGHHYASIAGAAPIVGPAIAVIWGWGPALLWIVLGSVFLGAVHDFSTLVMSMRHEGKSMGHLSGLVLGERSRVLFLWTIFALVVLVCAVFARAISSLFMAQPATLIPINAEIILALVIGWLCYRKGFKLLWPSLIALVIMYGLIPVGLAFPLRLDAFLPAAFVGNTWVILLFAYALIASLLPVWVLLQPRDLINAHQLAVGLVLLLLSVLIVRPEMTAPFLNTAAEGAPPMFPFLFITIACGAISGFHGLVSSGTSSKQLACAKDAKTVGYGAMLGEGLLAVLATVAVGAGLGDWAGHYHSFGQAAKSGVTYFVSGSAHLLGGLGLPEGPAAVVVAILVISFAATTLDTAVRIQRYILQELGEIYGWSTLQKPLPAALVAVTIPLLLCLAGQEKFLWPLFGASNQLLAGLSLLVISLWLYRQGKNWLYTGIPAVLVLSISGLSLLLNIQSYLREGKYILVATGCLLFGLLGWILFELQRVLKQSDAERVLEDL